MVSHIEVCETELSFLGVEIFSHNQYSEDWAFELLHLAQRFCEGKKNCPIFHL